MKTKIKKVFYTFSGFQIVWISCVFGELYGYSFFGLFIGLIYLYIFLHLNNNKKKALKICIIFSVIGYSFDSLLSFLKIYTIDSMILIGYLPIWFIVLWPSFSTLLVEVLSFLKNQIFLSVLFGSILGPITYYIGIPLGLASSDNLTFALLSMIFFWGAYMALYSFYLKKISL